MEFYAEDVVFLGAVLLFWGRARWLWALVVLGWVCCVLWVIAELFLQLFHQIYLLLHRQILNNFLNLNLPILTLLLLLLLPLFHFFLLLLITNMSIFLIYRLSFKSRNKMLYFLPFCRGISSIEIAIDEYIICRFLLFIILFVFFIWLFDCWFYGLWFMSWSWFGFCLWF